MKTVRIVLDDSDSKELFGFSPMYYPTPAELESIGLDPRLAPGNARRQLKIAREILSRRGEGIFKSEGDRQHAVIASRRLVNAARYARRCRRGS